jgi:hypothetical protein
MNFRFLLFDIAISHDQWWIGIANIERYDFDGHLFYLEKQHGYWKCDILWMRTLILRFLNK